MINVNILHFRWSESSNVVSANSTGVATWSARPAKRWKKFTRASDGNPLSLPMMDTREIKQGTYDSTRTCLPTTEYWKDEKRRGNNHAWPPSFLNKYARQNTLLQEVTRPGHRCSSMNEPERIFSKTVLKYSTDLLILRMLSSMYRKEQLLWIQGILVLYTVAR